jgi:hypothetical protein
MPYYLYRVSQIGPIRQLEKLAQFEKFKEASAAAKERRMTAAAGQEVFRVVFGENELQAEDTLNTPREVQPVFGDEW